MVGKSTCCLFKFNINWYIAGVKKEIKKMYVFLYNAIYIGILTIAD